jgi:hypothetical protein
VVLVYFGLDENECGQLEKLIKVLYSLSTLLRATLLSYAVVFSKPSLAACKNFTKWKNYDRTNLCQRD